LDVIGTQVLRVFLLAIHVSLHVHFEYYAIRNLEINIFTSKRFQQCIREETAHLATLKSKKYMYKLLTFSKRLQRLKQERQKSPAGTRQTDGKTWFGLEE
jgi:hypothetical protein